MRTSRERAEPVAEDLAAIADASLEMDLVQTVRTILMALSGSARLVLTELHVPGAPELATVVRGAPPASSQLALWPTSVPAARWHDGLLLVAAADEVTPHRRHAVRHAAALVADLVSSQRRILQAESLARRAIELAGVDPLTQLGNRRTWHRAVEHESKRSTRYGTAATVMVMDLDGLKQINDTQGHAAGDVYLKHGAAALRSVSRSVDVICRLGGDEFGLLAPETDAAGAAQLASRLRRAMAAAGVQASLGVATAVAGGLDAAWHSADADMYADKRSRACVSTPTASSAS